LRSTENGADATPIVMAIWHRCLQAYFTLVEFVMVILVIVVLAVMVVATVSAPVEKSVSLQAEQLPYDFSHLQLLAISTRKRIRVAASGSAYTDSIAPTPPAAP
jgi:hypothetical protein